MSTVFERINAWEADQGLDGFQRSLDWALYNESGGYFDRNMPGVKEGYFTEGDEKRTMWKRSKLSHAVGLSNEPGDSGGFTKFGVAQNAHPMVDVWNLDLAGAEAIYKKGYWDACRCDELPYEVAFQVFDAACGSGPGRAVKLLQRALGVTEDGKFGPATLAACHNADPVSFAEKFSEVRVAFGYSIAERDPSQAKWLPGWTRRWKVLKHGEKE